MNEEMGPYTRSITLERMKFTVMQYLDEQLLEDFAGGRQVELVEDVIMRQLVLQIRQVVYGREMERITVRYPVDWWQAFKQRWFPEWALKRWPVREHFKALVARELYPKFAMPDKDPMLNLWIENHGSGP